MCAFWAKQEGLKHEDKSIQEIFDKDVKHLTDSIVDYVVKWTTLGLLELKTVNKQYRGKEIWNSPETSKTSIGGLEPFGKAQKRGSKWLILCKLPVLQNR